MTKLENINTSKRPVVFKKDLKFNLILLFHFNLLILFINFQKITEMTRSPLI